MRRHPPYLAPWLAIRAAKLWDLGMDSLQIAQYLGASEAAVYNSLARRGAKKNGAHYQKGLEKANLGD